MSSKSEIRTKLGYFIKRKRGSKTQRQFAKMKGVNPKTLEKHESGIGDICAILKYIDSKEEFAELYELLK